MPCGSVYVLIDPRSGRACYVGKTILDPPEKRLAGHISLAHGRRRSQARVLKWIRALERMGLTPSFRVVEQVPIDDGVGELDAAERRWIARFRRNGISLFNHTDGGDGGATNRGVPMPPHVRKAIGEANRREANPQRAERIAEFKRRQWQDPEYRQRMTEAGLRGVKIASDAARGKPGRAHSDETKEKLRAAKLGKPNSPEARAKISAANKGNPLTHPEGWADSIRRTREERVRGHLMGVDRTSIQDGMSRAMIATALGVPFDRVKTWRKTGVLRGGVQTGNTIFFSATEVLAIFHHYGIGGDATP